MKREKIHMIPGLSVEATQNKTVLIGGGGATGSILAVTLAHLGVKHIKVVDKDILEKHNAENQIYTSQDPLGIFKVKILGTKIYEIDPDIEYISITKNIMECTENEVKADFYFSCFDNYPARIYMNDMAIFIGVPLIDSGINGFTGTIRIIKKGKTPCFHCWPNLIPSTSVKASCSRSPIPSTFITASFAANLQAMAYIRLVNDQDCKEYLYFDLQTYTMRKMSIEVNPECSVCGGGV